MAYYSSTVASSLANPPRQLTAPFGANPAQAGSTEYLQPSNSTSGNNFNAPGGGGGGLWFYASTNLTTDLTASGNQPFFTDGFYLGMRAGDMVMGCEFTSVGSSIVTFLGAVVSVSTAGAALSTGSFNTSTAN